jgi:hypothetical protein
LFSSELGDLLDFLADRTWLPLTLAVSGDACAKWLMLDKGPNALEVAVLEGNSPPNAGTLRTIWKERLAGPYCCVCVLPWLFPFRLASRNSEIRRSFAKNRESS